MTERIYMGNPIYKQKAGTISVAVFENKGKGKDGKEYVFKTVNLQRSYKDKDGEWQNQDVSLRSDEIPKATMLLGLAFKECVLKAKPEED